MIRYTTIILYFYYYTRVVWNTYRFGKLSQSIIFHIGNVFYAGYVPARDILKIYIHCIYIYSEFSTGGYIRVIRFTLIYIYIENTIKNRFVTVEKNKTAVRVHSMILALLFVIYVAGGYSVLLSNNMLYCDHMSCSTTYSKNALKNIIGKTL